MIENFVEYCKKREGDLVGGKLDNDDLINFEAMQEYWVDYVKLFLPVVGCSLPSEEELISELDKDLDKMKTHDMKLFRHRNYQRGYDAGFISAYEFIKK